MAGAEAARRLPMVGPGPAGKTPASVTPADGTRRYWVETWGCQMNAYDSGRLAGGLSGLGLVRAASAGEADVILLNTCSVRENAETKLYSRLGRLRLLKRDNPSLLVGVAGCVAQQEGEAVLRRSSVVDFVIGTKSHEALPQLLREAGAGRRAADVAMQDVRFDEPRAIDRDDPFRSYLTIVEGCDKSCSFCIVPRTRGPEVNRAPGSILAEAASALGTGAVEIELLGQNVNAYRHGDVDFADLLRLVDRLPGLARLRFRTSHPREFTDRVIAAMAETDHVCNHLHLPVQSGSTAVLKRMFRGYDRARYLSRVKKLRVRVPDVALSTDLIVGFPGETEAEFAETLSLLDEVGFDQVYAFVYSQRPGTHAARLDDSLPRAAKEDRLQRLLERQDAITLERNRALEGRVVEVLVDGPSRRHASQLHGRTTTNHLVNFTGPLELRGRVVEVRVSRGFAHSIAGELTARF